MRKRIKKIRQEKKWTQTELGEKVGVLKQQIYDWERGHNEPRMPAIKKLAKVLGVRINWLLTGR